MEKNKFDSYFNEFYSLQKEYENLLTKFINSNGEYKKIIEIHKVATKLFSAFEKAICEITVNPEIIGQAYIEDLVDSAINICESGILEHWNFISFADKKNDLKIFPNKNSYGTIQRLIRTYNKEESKRLLIMFKEKKLPTKGFEMKKKHKLNKGKTNKLQLIVGIVAFITSGLLIYLTPTNNGLRYLFIRILVSIGSGMIIGGAFSNRIKIKFKYKNLLITAAGTSAMFFIIYFYNPASIPAINAAAP